MLSNAATRMLQEVADQSTTFCLLLHSAVAPHVDECNRNCICFLAVVVVVVQRCCNGPVRGKGKNENRKRHSTQQPSRASSITRIIALNNKVKCALFRCNYYVRYDHAKARLVHLIRICKTSRRSREAYTCTRNVSSLQLPSSSTSPSSSSLSFALCLFICFLCKYIRIMQLIHISMFRVCIALVP